MDDWLIYRGMGAPDPDRIRTLPPPPPWRAFSGEPLPGFAPPDIDASSIRRLGNRGEAPPAQDAEALQLINAALYLRRPLLVTGEPGSGKSTLAHSIAYELGLGRVLQWPVVSRTELKDGLYTYDAIGRLQDAQLAERLHPGESDDIGRYIRLGPLGTALLPAERPRVLLIDELDKSDIDLPNDLLNVVEEGEFALPELERIADRPGQDQVRVLTDDGLRVPVHAGRVRCHAFPFVVMTSNGERDFPAPLLRRCIQLHLDPPRDERLAAMVQAHFGVGADELNLDLIGHFTSEDGDGELRPTDQLLNAIYLTQHTLRTEPDRREEIADLLMRPLDIRHR
ncbi:AAA family ATPase [Streptomyces albipurpureus]|uniref:MoxR family ATPase n=1 Tax=Streptomyces albipurpureus TaxID=2897419 RepID=A0ABT0UHA4_9ACTN|nr:MoxR family ATPase [Streptomyces sp. CWNU-1]MCM2388018.1 MoxR family ATPase [Streptomyces sp. CWNU-1]